MKSNSADDFLRIFRYTINGVVATVIHFLVLAFCVEVLAVPVIGLANVVASCFGITASFVGNRYFVFLSKNPNVVYEFRSFVLLYVVIALFHGVILYCWADVFQADYRIGFLIATLFQFICSYIGNKNIVFLAGKTVARGSD